MDTHWVGYTLNEDSKPLQNQEFEVGSRQPVPHMSWLTPWGTPVCPCAGKIVPIVDRTYIDNICGERERNAWHTPNNKLNSHYRKMNIIILSELMNYSTQEAFYSEGREDGIKFHIIIKS